MVDPYYVPPASEINKKAFLPAEYGVTRRYMQFRIWERFRLSLREQERLTPGELEELLMVERIRQHEEACAGA